MKLQMHYDTFEILMILAKGSYTLRSGELSHFLFPIDPSYQTVREVVMSALHQLALLLIISIPV